MPKEARSLGKENPADITRRAKDACGDLRRASSVVNRRIPPEPLCEELHEAVERAAARNEASMNALRAAVCRFTAALKDDGASPESILVSLKTVINSRTFPVIPSREQEWTAEDLRQRISTWAIEEFFSETQA